MIFLGDIAHPFAVAPDWSPLIDIAHDEFAIVNLEGALTDDLGHLTEAKLFNHVSILESLRAIRTKVVCLANNHITDIDSGATNTALTLASEGMSPVGAGASPLEAASPVSIDHGGREYIFVAFGWPTIQCVPAQSHREGVNPLEPDHVLQTVKELRLRRGDAAIIAMFHWNIELERYPHPAHRELAFDVIEAGASAVIGHHPHCVGGFEFHRGCPIAYSLGDWWIPQSVFFNGRLSFPDYTLRQVAFEWSAGQMPILHWFDYDRPSHKIIYHSSETITGTYEDLHHTPFSGLSNSEYKRWFRSKRVKRKALPIYWSYKWKFRNLLRDRYIAMRHRMILLIRSLSVRIHD